MELSATITLIIWLLVIGFVAYLIQYHAPVAPLFKKIIYFILFMIVLLKCLDFFGIYEIAALFIHSPLTIHHSP